MTQADWNAELYVNKHDFVWKYGSGVLDLLEPKPGEHILDLGCGTGELSAQIASSGAKVTGLDASSAMIEKAQTHFPALEHPGLEWRIQSALEMTFEAEFEAIFSNAALHWIPSPEKVVSNMARALKPGGRLVAELGGKGNVAGVVQALESVLSDAGFTIQNPWYFPSVAEYASLLEQSGLQVRLAQLFERPTPLKGGPGGIHHWLEMFSIPLLKNVPLERQAELLARVEDQARARLWDGEKWMADYVRLRVVAVKA